MRKISYIVLRLPAAIATVFGSSVEKKMTEKEVPSMIPLSPSKAKPDSTKLVNDSVIVPDVTPGNGRQVGKSDSIQINKH